MSSQSPPRLPTRHQKPQITPGTPPPTPPQTPPPASQERDYIPGLSTFFENEKIKSDPVPSKTNNLFPSPTTPNIKADRPSTCSPPPSNFTIRAFPDMKPSQQTKSTRPKPQRRPPYTSTKPSDNASPSSSPPSSTPSCKPVPSSSDNSAIPIQPKKKNDAGLLSNSKDSTAR